MFPSVIDYTDLDLGDDPVFWSSTGLRKYFKDTHWKIHKVGGAIAWTLKEQAMLKRMRTEYPNEQIADMIVYWHTHQSNPAVAASFKHFYAKRSSIYFGMKRSSEEYSWD